MLNLSITRPGIIKSLDSNGYSFNSVSLDPKYSTNTLVKILKFSPLIQELSLIDLSAVNDEVLETVSNCVNIKSLNLSNFRFCNFTENGLNYLTSTLRNLKELHLKSCNSITNQNLIALSENAKGLNVLNFSGCYNISDAGLIAILNLPQLRKLNTSLCWRITNESFKQIIQKEQHQPAPALNILELNFCYQLSNNY